MDALPAAGMVEEREFFDRTRMHLAVFGQLHCRLGEAVGLAYGIQAERVGFGFHAAGDGENRGQSRLSSRSSVSMTTIFGLPILFGPIFRPGFVRSQGGSVGAVDALMLDVPANGIGFFGIDCLALNGLSRRNASTVRNRLRELHDKKLVHGDTKIGYQLTQAGQPERQQKLMR